MSYQYPYTASTGTASGNGNSNSDNNNTPITYPNSRTCLGDGRAQYQYYWYVASQLKLMYY